MKVILNHESLLSPYSSSDDYKFKSGFAFFNRGSSRYSRGKSNWRGGKFFRGKGQNYRGKKRSSSKTSETSAPKRRSLQVDH